MLVRWRLRTLVVLIALVAWATATGIRMWQWRQADDSGHFYTYEEMADHEAFSKVVALKAAKAAESKAATDPRNKAHWEAEAATLRAKAEALVRSEADHRWRASLKKRLIGSGK